MRCLMRECLELDADIRRGSQGEHSCGEKHIEGDEEEEEDWKNPPRVVVDAGSHLAVHLLAGEVEGAEDHLRKAQLVLLTRITMADTSSAMQMKRKTKQPWSQMSAKVR